MHTIQCSMLNVYTTSCENKNWKETLQSLNLQQQQKQQMLEVEWENTKVQRDQRDFVVT